MSDAPYSPTTPPYGQDPDSPTIPGIGQGAQAGQPDPPAGPRMPQPAPPMPAQPGAWPTPPAAPAWPRQGAWPPPRDAYAPYDPWRASAAAHAPQPPPPPATPILTPRLSKPEALRRVGALKRAIIAGSVVAFAVLAGLAASHQTGVTSTQAAPNNDSSPFAPPARNNGGFFGQQPGGSGFGSNAPFQPPVSGSSVS
jgi:hypothetical protein